MTRLVKKPPRTYIYWLFFTGLCVLAIIVLISAWGFDTTSFDVYFSWVEGARLLELENPYARILQGNMRENEKYATYFPLFYLLSAGSQLAGALIIFSLPFISSLPFLIWEAEGFVRSILFSVTRYSNFYTGLGRRLLGDGGLPSRIPMFLVLGTFII